MDKSKNFVLWGSSGHAKVLADLIFIKRYKIIALFDNDLNAITCLPNVPLYYGATGLKEWIRGQDSITDIFAAIAIGGSRGKDRATLGNQLQLAGLNLATLIHPTASIAQTVKIGTGCQILANAVVAADSTMGDACIVNNSANIDHECQLGHGVHIAPGAVLCGCISVSDNAMIGAGAVILPRLRIGRNAIIGAGAVVTKDVPDGVTVFGNPAKIYRRNA